MENGISVPQPAHPAVALILAHPDLFMRQGSVRPKWLSSGKKLLGPYYCLRFRRDGRQRSLYLGREGPLVQQVRALLAQLQASARLDRQRKKSRRQLRSLLRGSNVNLSARLASLGLRIKGSEIRGWRNLPFPL